MSNFNSIYLFYIFIGLSAAMFAEGVYLLVYSNASYRKKINRRLKVCRTKPTVKAYSFNCGANAV